MVRNKLTPDNEKLLVLDREHGLTWKELREKYDVSHDTVGKILKRNNYSYEKEKSLQEKFLLNCPVNDNIEICWIWKGSVRSDGYGRLKKRDFEYAAHIYSYEYFISKVPDGLVLDHICHNLDFSCGGGPECEHRKCVNPYHLEPTTRAINTMRGRGQGAENFRKTHCIRGHPLSGENLDIGLDGARRCKKCRNMREVGYNKRRAVIGKR